MEIYLNSNAIQHETDKGVLIKLPGEDLKFWHPKKMVRQSGKRGYLLTVWVPNGEWSVKATRTSKKNFEVLATWEGTMDEAVATFNLKTDQEEGDAA